MGLKTLQSLVTTALAVLPFANAQQPGTQTPEVHPQLATCLEHPRCGVLAREVGGVSVRP